MVDAIEEAFVPLLVKNNQPGKDAEALKRFNEPAWNYQVIRFLDAKGRDVLPRKDRVWTLPAVALRMMAALEKHGRPVPKYLQAVVADTSQVESSRVAFAMACFWAGEMKLGQIEGVLRTEAGWLDGREVTLVDYDPATVSLNKLMKKAASVDCAQRVYLPEKATRADLKTAQRSRLHVGVLDSSYRKAKNSDQKRQLQGTGAARLNLSPVQATKLNAWIRVDAFKAREWLSPSQREVLKLKGNR